mmetsp:Transcript_8736/g.15256  ORF Transcript_8736/g.15256 Transcript_8736/m.15256 type:complete len:101 (-) Transcript_8736:81-383(-)
MVSDLKTSNVKNSMIYHDNRERRTDSYKAPEGSHHTSVSVRILFIFSAALADFEPCMGASRGAPLTYSHARRETVVPAERQTLVISESRNPRTAISLRLT